MLYWLFKYTLFTPWIKLFVRPRIRNREHLPRHGGAILAANHSSATETILLPAIVPRKVVFPAKAELFAMTKGDWRHNVVAWFLRSIGQVPVDRAGGRNAIEAMRPIIERLQQGHVVGIFPEGTRTPDGRLYRGHTGVARMALLSGFPVVPVGLKNTAPRNLVDLIRHKPELTFGEPVVYDRFVGRENDGEVLRWVTDDVMARIQEVTGKQYVDIYARSVKRGNVTVEEGKLLSNPHEGKTEPMPSAGQPPVGPA